MKYFVDVKGALASAQNPRLDIFDDGGYFHVAVYDGQRLVRIVPQGYQSRDEAQQALIEIRSSLQ